MDLLDILRSGNHSLVVRSSAGEITTYSKKGVRDLIWLLDNEPERLKGAVIADKVTGKAASGLCAVGGVVGIHTEVMSELAVPVLESSGIKYDYEQLVPRIVIPEGDDRCPLEEIVQDAESPEEIEHLLRKHFEEMKDRKRFGFGCMRLPMKGGEVDLEETARMVDCFIENGFNYFDTAHGYLGGKSETALKACLTSRYPRESYLLVDKLTHGMFEKSPEGIRKFFASQLEACGVEYFDYYLMHAQNNEFFNEFKACRAYETAFELKAEGKVRHVGLSFHDKAEVLDRILTEYPGIELVQIQFNYLDYEDPVIQSRLCYEVCRKHGKPVVVMEPVKGGTLAHLPEDAARILSGLGTGESQASYAIRYVASFPGIMMTLSGMSSLEQMQDNISFMKDLRPFTEEEMEAVAKVRGIFESKKMIACTGCRYCTDGCPMDIPIPDLFADLNAKKIHRNWNSDWYFMVHTRSHGKPSDCIECGQCEGVCPQHLPITDLMKEAARQFEKKR